MPFWKHIGWQLAQELFEYKSTAQAAAAFPRLGRGGGERGGKLLEKWSFPSKKKSEVFIKSLDGKLMMVSFDEEESVQDLHMRVAKQVGVSENKFLLQFHSRILKATRQEGLANQSSLLLQERWDRVHCGGA